MATTTIIDLNQRNRNAGAYNFDANQPIPDGIRFATFTLPMDLADKLADGITIDLKFSFAPTNGGTYEFANGTTWHSYGPGGFVRHNPDGTTTDNPDPGLQVPLLTRVGQFIRGEVTLSQQLNIGVIVTIDT